MLDMNYIHLSACWCVLIKSMNCNVHFRGVKVDYLISTPRICSTTRIKSYAMTCRCTNNHQSSTMHYKSLHVIFLPQARCQYCPILLSHTELQLNINIFKYSSKWLWEHFFSWTMIEYQQSILPSFIGHLMITHSTPHVFKFSNIFPFTIGRHASKNHSVHPSFPQVHNYQNYTVHVDRE